MVELKSFVVNVDEQTIIIIKKEKSNNNKEVNELQFVNLPAERKSDKHISHIFLISNFTMLSCHTHVFAQVDNIVTAVYSCVLVVEQGYKNLFLSK